MKRPRWILPIALLLVVGTPSIAAEPDREQEAAIAALKKLGGLVRVDRNKAVTVVLLGESVTDATLEYLKGPKSLQSLILAGTKVTDEGVKSSLLLAAVATLGLSFGWRRGQRTA